MDDPLKVIQPPLEKKDVLDAIDCEIAHRESMLSRHGISTWGVMGITAALLWAAVTEALSPSYHNLTNVLLVLLAANWLLAFLSSPWLKALGIGRPKDAPTRRLNELIIRLGFDAHSIPYHAAHAVSLLFLGVYVGFKGFLLLSVTVCAFYSLVILVLGFCWLAGRVRMPLMLPSHPKTLQSQFRAAILSRLLILVVALVPFDALRSVWPVEASDARLGLMLAALASLWSLSISVLRPPTTTDSLREVRSQLSFGEISVEDGKLKAQCILRGSPEEKYLQGKADEIILELTECVRLCNLFGDWEREVIQLADRLPKSGAERLGLRDIALEYRGLFNRAASNAREMRNRMDRVASLRRELGIRAEAAMRMLAMKPALINEIVGNVDVLGRQVDEARLKVLNHDERFRPATELLSQKLKEVLPGGKWSLRDAYTAFFKD